MRIVCVWLAFSVEHSIEEVLGLSLQLADPRLLLFEGLTLRQHLAASTVLRAVLLHRQTHRDKWWVKACSVKNNRPSHHKWAPQWPTVDAYRGSSAQFWELVGEVLQLQVHPKLFIFSLQNADYSPCLYQINSSVCSSTAFLCICAGMN